MKIDINVDMGESFGRYVLGNDQEVMKNVTSANVACGFHAGDPLVLEQTLVWAKENNVAVGAHVGLNDMQGFGRREMNITEAELRSDVIYQLGAMDGFLKVHGMVMQHIKPHGILYRMVSENEKYIDTFLDAVKDYNEELFIMLPENTPAFQRGIDKGLKMAGEALIDLSYDDEGNWVLERTKKARTPSEVAERALSIAKTKEIATTTGKMLSMPNAVTVCLHGDAPNAVETSQVVKQTLLDNGVELSNLFDL